MNAMKNIQELVHSKEMEILKAVEESARQQETELRRVQSSLIEALRVINRLLETDQPEAAVAATSVSVSPVPAPAVAPRPAPVPNADVPGKYEGYPRVAAVRMSGTQFP